MNMNEELVPYERIEKKIYLIRGQKVMLDRDLAELYGVLTKYLNKQVKRNIARFPADFMFQLTKEEAESFRHRAGALNSRFQFGTLKPGQNIKYLPYVFTEQGVAMLSSVLNSERAILVNIQIMRTFTKLRKMFVGYKELKDRLDQLESRYDGQFKAVFDAINEMISEPPTKVKGVGFLK
jgi:ORF6N domain